jgi:tetraacyldisaccharide 4'-kinase
MDYFTRKWPGILLRPFSLLYGLGMQARNFCYDKNIFKTHKVDCPVISVGNITVGGTGKTPTVAYLAKWFSVRGKKVAVLSRGYARASKGTVVVATYNGIVSNVKNAGDEAFMLSRQLKGVPIVVDESRVRGAEKLAREFSPEIILLDDGFQHRRLYRDVDILSFNARFGLGNGFVLPAGPLREFAFNMKRCDFYWVNDIRNSGNVGWPFLRDKPIFRAIYESAGVFNALGPVVADDLQEKVFAFCGVASPTSFRKSLVEYGLDIADMMVFNDHHVYSMKDMETIHKEAAKNNAELFITTEKDWVKIVPFVKSDPNWHYLRMHLQLENENLLENVFHQFF